MYREQIQNESISWDISKVDGTKSVVLCWATIGWQEVLKIGKYSRAKSKLLSDHSLMSKFKKLLTKNKNLGSLWTGSINTNCLPLKSSSIMINNVLTLITCGMPFILHCYIQVHLFRNYISAVISFPNYTSLPSTVATFLATCLMVVL